MVVNKLFLELMSVREIPPGGLQDYLWLLDKRLTSIKDIAGYEILSVGASSKTHMFWDLLMLYTRVCHQDRSELRKAIDAIVVGGKQVVTRKDLDMVIKQLTNNG